MASDYGKRALARDVTFELYNATEFTNRMAEAARVHIADGDLSSAIESLEAAERYADSIETRLRDAIRYCKEARDEGRLHHAE